MSTPSNSAQETTSRSHNRTVSASDQRKAAKRRQALGNRLRSFEASLPLPRAGKRKRTSAPSKPSASSTRPSGARTSARSASAGARLATASVASTAAQLGFTGFHWSKLLSLSALCAMLFGLYYLQSDSAWYVMPQQTTVAGYRLVDPNALYSAADIDGWNIFWLRRDAIRARLLENPWITDAQVSLRAPGSVTLQVEESPVVAVWMTDGGNYWISPSGAAMRFEGEVPPTMPRLVDPQQQAAVPGAAAGSEVDTKVIGSALALISQMSGLLEVRYSQAYGLNFALPGTGLWVYWGDGTQTEEKLEAIAVGKQYVASGELETQILDVRIPERPFVK